MWSNSESWEDEYTEVGESRTLLEDDEVETYESIERVDGDENFYDVGCGKGLEEGRNGSVCEPATTTKTEFWFISRNAIPLIITFLLQFSLSTVSVFFAGRLGTTVIGGVSVANVTFTVTSAIFVGLATCLDTMCPQAYGSGNHRMVGLYFQRGVAISFVMSIPIIAFWFYSKPVLSLLVQDKELVTIAATNLRIMILSVPGFILFECGKKFLQAQGNYTTGQNILFVCSPLNIMLNYLFVCKWKIGYIGSPIAAVITYSIMGTSFSFYVVYQRMKGRCPCWSPIRGNVHLIFKNWSPLVYLAIPGIIMLEAEFFAFEILTILSASFGTDVLAAQSIAASVQALTFQLPFSCSVAASNRIAYHIGSGKINNCIVATKASINYVGSLVAVTTFSIAFFGRYYLARFFTDEPALIDLSAQLLGIIGINQLYDVFNVVAAGVLRAQGRQRIGSYLNIVTYYIVGLPLGCFLAFKCHLEVKGFWIGLGVAIFLLASAENYCIYTSNWISIMHDSHKLRDKV